MPQLNANTQAKRFFLLLVMPLAHTLESTAASAICPLVTKHYSTIRMLFHLLTPMEMILIGKLFGLRAELR